MRLRPLERKPRGKLDTHISQRVLESGRHRSLASSLGGLDERVEVLHHPDEMLLCFQAAVLDQAGAMLVAGKMLLGVFQFDGPDRERTDYQQHHADENPDDQRHEMSHALAHYLIAPAIQAPSRVAPPPLNAIKTPILT